MSSNDRVQEAARLVIGCFWILGIAFAIVAGMVVAWLVMR